MNRNKCFKLFSPKSSRIFRRSRRILLAHALILLPPHKHHRIKPLRGGKADSFKIRNKRLKFRLGASQNDGKRYPSTSGDKTVRTEPLHARIKSELAAPVFPRFSGQPVEKNLTIPLGPALQVGYKIVYAAGISSRRTHHVHNLPK